MIVFDVWDEVIRVEKVEKFYQWKSGDNSLKFIFKSIIFQMPEECIKVFVRVRPFTEKETAKNTTQFLSMDQSEKQLTVRDINSQRKSSKTFTFDDIFPPETSQTAIFEAASKHLTRQVLQGYNGTVLAYGQTGSGKTYTMMGELREDGGRGIIPRCFESILESAKAEKSRDFLIMCSYIELYNEQLRDLLHLSDKCKLELRESPEKGVFIKDLKKVPITTASEMMKYLKIGNQNRTTGETLMNTESSRSHSIFTIYVESLEKGPEATDKVVGSKFNLVDLAGSERQSKTGSIGDRFLEATKINLSLTALGKVISVLVEGKGSFVPYRDSKLTRLLQDSLGGNAKTVMIATVSPSSYNYEETISTLKYASRAKYITNVPVINLDPKDALLKEYQSQIRRLRTALGQIQKEEQPSVDVLMEENRRIAKQAEEERKELISKIQRLQEQFISTPHQLPQKYKQQRNIREQKLTYMQKNYKSLEAEVADMKELLNDLRKKYKAASKEIFQMETDHQKERELIREEADELKRENVVFKSILAVLFTDKQLKNIIGLGSWEGDNRFKLPTFYFKDRHTLAFPCEEPENQISYDQTRPPKDRSQDKYQTTATSFGARVNGLQTSSSKGSIVARRK